MGNTSKKLEGLLASSPVKNEKKLKQQQEYYKRLTKNGTAQKQTYNLKPVSAI